MVARPESWSQSVDVRRAAVSAAVAIGVFCCAWGLLHRGFYAREQIRDTRLYYEYGSAVVAGRVPYRDFALEYPPGALPVFVLPALAGGADDERRYRTRFEWLMLACGGAVLGFMAAALGALARNVRNLAAALAFAALAPLALGSVVLSRFDLWPAAVTAGALAAVVAGRTRIAFGALALAAAAKLYPLVLVPIAAAHVARRRSRREAAVGAAIFGGVLAACFLPFLVAAPGGLLESIERQLGRPLQIESLGAGLLVAAHHLGGLGLTVESGAGSQNLAGTLPTAVGVAQTVLQVAVLAGIWLWFARGRAGDRERVVRAAAASVCAFVALGKVLSPQFLIWLVPLIPLVRGARGLAASGLLALALVLTQLWFPYRYWDYALDFDETASVLVLMRNAALVGLLAVLLWPDRIRPARAKQVLHDSRARDVAGGRVPVSDTVTEA